MPAPLTQKLCTCKVLGCYQKQEVDARTSRVIRGQYLPKSTWNRHRDAQQEADVEAQTESLANMTLLRTVVSGEATSSNSASDNSSTTISGPVHMPSRNTGDGAPSHESAARTRLIDRSTADLHHLGSVLDQKIAAFHPPRSLQFASPPAPLVPYKSQFTTSPSSNTGLHALLPRHAGNAALMGFEAWLIQALEALNKIETYQDRILMDKQRLHLEKISHALSRVDDVKKSEWERQRSLPEITPYDDDSGAPQRVDTRTYLDSSLHGLESIPLICVFIATVLNVLCHVSRERCNFFLFSLRYLVSKALDTDLWYGKKVLSSIPMDVRTARTHFDIEPKLITYVCCPRCCALYAPDAVGQPDAYPETCDKRDPSAEANCGARLRKSRYISGKLYTMPIRTYVYQDFPSWLARLLCRPGFEALLDKPLLSVGASPKDVYRDIWDGAVVRDFLGPDGQPFFQYSGPEARLLFGLSYDNFNPFHNKAAGKVVSVGAIFAVCYNLPEEIRFKHENIYLVGIVPGPKAPSLTQSNHYMRPLISQFAMFWSRGFHFTETPSHPTGRLAKGAFIPLIMDLHALRQISGSGAFNSRYFCTFCMLLHQDIDNCDPTSWPKVRSDRERRKLAESWRDAITLEERENLFEANSLRWTVVYELIYWVATVSMVVDTLHAWFLNDCKTLVRVIWGVDHNSPSGDGLFVSKRPPSKYPVTKKELINALVALFKDETTSHTLLKKVRKVVLYELCEARELRRSDTCYQMIQNLTKFYNNNPDHLRADIAAIKARQENAATAENSHEAATRSRLLSVTSETSNIDQKWLTGRRKPILQQLCKEREIFYGDKELRAGLAAKLIEHQLLNPCRPDRSQLAARKPMAVLGADMVAEINADISRTVLPSWAASGPSSFDSSEHGKPSGDEWRTIALIRLVVTLPRVWGSQGGRRQLMLENFMHLTNAITIGSSRSIIARPTTQNGATKSTADIYREEYQAYLQGRVELYPTGKITPTEHISYHIGEKLEQYGPVHSWRVNAFERYNGMLQDSNMNMRFGELEGTFMRAFCVGANLKALVNDPSSPEPLQELRKHFQAAFGSADQGSLFRDILEPDDHKDDSLSEEGLANLPRFALIAEVSQPLIECLNSQYSNSANFRRYIPADHRGTGIPIDSFGWSLAQCNYRGLCYRQARPTRAPLQLGSKFVPHRDSHILIKKSSHSRPVPCAIHNIFAHRHLVPGYEKPVVETYLVVREYRPLEQNIVNRDPWRRFPLSGGRLYYDDLVEDCRVVNVKDVAGHFAKTPYDAGEVLGIDSPCIHVLPLSWHQLFDTVVPDHLNE